MISYAQNHEDVVLARAFAGQRLGFYIDVGAWHPALDSVTRHFYDQGWRGINVEPSAEYHRLLQAERPRDLNLNVALSDRSGRAPFFRVHGSGLSSLEEVDPAQLAPLGLDLERSEVAVATLAELCEAHVDGEIDFLKIDVEGSEGAVIAGADWSRFRPRVLVIEAVAVDPRRFAASGAHQEVRPTWPQWEPALIAAGYELCLFDGLNRFYVRREDGALKPALQLPANVLDVYVPSRQIDLEAALAESQARAVELEERMAQAVADLAAKDVDIEFLGRQLESLSERLQTLTGRLEVVSRHRDDLRVALDASETDRRRALSSAVDLERKVEALQAELSAAAAERELFLREREASMREVNAWRERVAAMEQTSAWRWRQKLLRLRRSGRSGPS